LTLVKATKLADELNAKGYQTLAIKANVLEPENIKAAHQEVLKTFGPTDILINCAGGNNPRATTTDEFFDIKT
jgi:NAD(P)-dependent dehydrogenase (short-subunit alcohol dehydrogenase family)